MFRMLVPNVLDLVHERDLGEVMKERAEEELSESIISCWKIHLHFYYIHKIGSRARPSACDIYNTNAYNPH
jgi:hypothetical protein